MFETGKETLMNIRMYKFLLGTLSKEGVKTLREEIAKRFQREQTNSALEVKLHAAFTVKQPTRKYLAELLDDWEKRTAGIKS